MTRHLTAVNFSRKAPPTVWHTLRRQVKKIDWATCRSDGREAVITCQVRRAMLPGTQTVAARLQPVPRLGNSLRARPFYFKQLCPSTWGSVPYSTGRVAEARKRKTRTKRVSREKKCDCDWEPSEKED